MLTQKIWFSSTYLLFTYILLACHLLRQKNRSMKKLLNWKNLALLNLSSLKYAWISYVISILCCKVAKKSLFNYKVQTFGHMEHVLKLEEFVPLREVQNNPLSLCPTKPDSFQLVQTMIDQILTLHQGHIKVSNYY